MTKGCIRRANDNDDGKSNVKHTRGCRAPVPASPDPVLLPEDSPLDSGSAASSPAPGDPIDPPASVALALRVCVSARVFVR
jgi:hypothetical protein